MSKTEVKEVAALTPRQREHLVEYFDGDELAADVWEKKYRFDNEKHPEHMFERLSAVIAEKEFQKISKIRFFNKKLKKLSDKGQSFFAGKNKQINPAYSQYFNLLDNWGIVLGGSGMQGIGVPNKFSSISNCFVVGRPYDSYGGIMQKGHDLIQLEKRRGGVGVDLSSIRPKGAIVHNQSNVSSGVVLFAERYSNDTKEVAQDGRRGALMISLHIAHPDALAFAQAKQDDTKITGANISLQVDKEFMDAVNNPQSEYLQRWPIDMNVKSFMEDKDPDAYINWNFELNKLTEVDYVDNDGKVQRGYVKRIDARETWFEICRCAHNRAEPGIIFLDNHLSYAPDSVYAQYRGITTNPCSEIFMQPYDACRLLAANFLKFVVNPFSEHARFDTANFKAYIYAQLIIGDILVDIELDHIARIIDKIKNSYGEPEELRNQEIAVWKKVAETAASGRRIGAGFLALGDVIAAMGFKYGSKESLEFADKIFRMKMQVEMQATTDLAILYGPFKGFNARLEKDGNYLYRFMEQTFPEEFARMQQYGRRNVSWSTAAPTGSQAILTQTTSGIEPLFKPYYKRRKKCITDGERVDFVDVDGCKFTEYFVFHMPFKHWLTNIKHLSEQKISALTASELEELFKQSPWYGSCAEDIAYEDRIKMQAVVQKYTTHSISSTINLPKDCTVDDISNIYLLSEKYGLKGITVYREGSRKGILVSADSNVNQTFQGKRPRELAAQYHTISYRNKTYAAIIGLKDGVPYELFVISDVNNLPENIMQDDVINGKIIKEATNMYYFECDTFTIKDIQDAEHDEKLTSLFISALLSSGMPITKVIKIIGKTKPMVTAFTNRLIKLLSPYIPNGEDAGDLCPDCKQKLTYENGCVICKNCGHSKC